MDLLIVQTGATAVAAYRIACVQHSIPENRDSDYIQISKIKETDSMFHMMPDQ